MGIVSVVAFALGLIALLIVRAKLHAAARDLRSDDPNRGVLVWASRLCLAVVLVAAVGIVDGYLWKIPNPFSGPKAGNALPTSSPPPPTPIKPDIKADDLRPDMDAVRQEHRRQLREFEQGPQPAERNGP